MRGAPGRGRGAALVALLAALALGGCTPLYLPPVPASTVRPEPRLAFEARSGLARVDGRPELALALREVPAEGWLALQWFGPDDRPAGSDSVWLEPGMEGLVLRLPPPAGAPAADGAWRVVASFGGAVVRQFALAAPPAEEAAGADPEDGTP